MLTAQRLDDNPCRPRHFKPPPCAPVVADPKAAALLELTRTRLLLTASIFSLVFLIVIGRLGYVVELDSGTGDPRVAKARLVSPPPAPRADIVDRNGALLATNLDSPALYVNSKQMLQAGENPERAAQQISKALPDLSPADIRAKLASGRSFAYLKRSLNSAPGVSGQQSRHPRHRIQRRRAPHLPAWRPCLAFGRLLQHRQ